MTVILKFLRFHLIFSILLFSFNLKSQVQVKHGVNINNSLIHKQWIFGVEYRIRIKRWIFNAGIQNNTYLTNFANGEYFPGIEWSFSYHLIPPKTHQWSAGIFGMNNFKNTSTVFFNDQQKIKIRQHHYGFQTSYHWRPKNWLIQVAAGPVIRIEKTKNISNNINNENYFFTYKAQLSVGYIFN